MHPPDRSPPFSSVLFASSSDNAAEAARTSAEIPFDIAVVEGVPLARGEAFTMPDNLLPRR